MELSLRNALVCTSTLALLTVVACDPQVAVPGDEQHIEDSDGPDDGDEDPGASSDPGDDAGSAEGSTTVGTGQSCEGDDCEEPIDPPPPPLGEEHAFAIHWGDVPEVDVGESDSGGSGGGDGGNDIDPESILVVIGNGADGCGDPWGGGGCGQWGISFTLPADIVPGSYPLFPDLNGMQSATGPDRGGGDCWGGGGSLEGTLVIDAIDDAVIVGRITDAVSFDFDANVEFSAGICQ
jgi:hypothetical protein